MSHRYYDGVIHHKRFAPKVHEFSYNFFLLDFEVSEFESLTSSLFSREKFNLFSFYAKDHFGKSNDFKKNVADILEQLGIAPQVKMRFMTLPRISGFVFNPLSVLILFDTQNRPTHMIAEVHNYNGGRVLYSSELSTSDNRTYKAKSIKDMYVSPFFKRDGNYEFTLIYSDEKILLSILLFEGKEKMLSATFKADALEFSKKSVVKLFCKHTFLTLWVVTRTLYQSLKLKLKGLKFHSPTPQDQIRRY